MGINERERERKRRMDPGADTPGQPAKSRFWMIVLAIVAIAIVIWMTWPHH